MATKEIGYIGKELNLKVRQGATFGPIRLTITNPDGTPIDLTDLQFRGQVRKDFDSLDVSAVISFTVDDPFSGMVEIVIPAMQTENLVAGASLADTDSLYVYDIEAFDSVNVFPVLYGRIRVFREITKGG